MSEKRNSLQSLALRCAAVFAAGILTVAGRAAAEVPQQINHQGVVSVDSERFDGNGLFRFAIVAPDGTNLWSNDGSITGIVGGFPAGPVALPVSNGVYSVSLGNTSLANMTDEIAPSVFAGNNAVLRIWFDDGVNGNQLLTPDHKLTTVPYSARLPNVFIDDSGNVGIGGPPNPIRIFQVTGGEPNNRIRLKQTNPGSLGSGGIEFADFNDEVKWSIGTRVITGPGFEINSSGVSGGNIFYIRPTGPVTIGGGATVHTNESILSVHSSAPALNQSVLNVGWIGVNDGAMALLTLDVDIDGNEGGRVTFFKVLSTGAVTGVYGDYHVASDARLKRNIVNIPNALQRVVALRGINFKWKDSHTKGDSLRIGMIAQEVEKVFPEAVHTADDGMKTKAVEYPFLVAALVEAIKELDGIVKQKDAELGAQRRRIGTVESRLAALEARLQKVGQADRRD